MHIDAARRTRIDDAHTARHSRSERRVWSVVALTGATMTVELVVGAITHSLALTVDGWHMATHAGVLGFSGLAYGFARTRGKKGHFAFGTGKVYALAGYTNAIVLLLVALLMTVESIERLLYPEPVAFAQALPVALLGLASSVASVALLGSAHGHGDPDHGRDHNLRAAYLHLLGDALTSVLAIIALLGGRYLGLGLLDPVAGLIGAGAITYWGIGLLRGSASQLLDMAASPALANAIRARLESLGDAEVVSFQLWQIGPSQLGCNVSLVTSVPRTLAAYRAAILDVAQVAHLTVEVGSRLDRDSLP